MNLVTVLGLIGFPSLFVAALLSLNEKIKKNAKMTIAVQIGIQALLRDRLYQLARYCMNNGHATTAQRENFENMYKQYHTLGANGVMDDVREKFLKLPIQEDEFY